MARSGEGLVKSWLSSWSTTSRNIALANQPVVVRMPVRSASKTYFRHVRASIMTSSDGPTWWDSPVNGPRSRILRNRKYALCNPSHGLRFARPGTVG